MSIEYKIPDTKKAFIRENDKVIELCRKSRSKVVVTATYNKDEHAIFINGKRKTLKAECYRSFKHYIESRYNLVTPDYIFYEHFRDEKFKEPRHYITPLGEVVYYSPFHTESHDCYVIDDGNCLMFVEYGCEIAFYIKGLDVIQCHNAFTNTVRKHFKWFADFICHKFNIKKMIIWVSTYDHIRILDELVIDELVKYGIIDKSDYEYNAEEDQTI